MKTKNIYNNIEENLIFILLMAVFIIMLLQIFARIFSNYSIYWNLEFCQLGLVFLTFLGSSYVERKKSHIQIEALSNQMNKIIPRKGRLIFFLFKKTIVIFFLITLIYWSFELGVKSWNIRTASMQIRTAWVYFVVSVGSFSYLLRVVESTINSIKSFRKGGKII